MISHLFDLVGNISVNMQNFDQAMNTVQNSTRSVSQNIQNVGDTATNMGKQMSLGVTTPIVGALGASVKAAVDLETAFAGVRKTVDATESEYDDLREGILKMTREVPASAEAISAVAESAGQLGIQKDNILDFSRVMIDLAESTDMTGEMAATQFARFANIAKMSEKDYDRLGSSLVNLGNNVAATESEIMTLAMRLVGQTTQIGITEHQTLALSAAMKEVGINAEAGGTAMTLIMKKMQAATMEGGATLDEMAKIAGVTSKEFQKQFKDDAVVAIDMFIKGLGKMGDEGENLAAVLENVGMKGVYEQDTLLRLAGASDALTNSLKISSEGWEENNALTNEAAERYKTTASQFKIFRNGIKEIAYDVGGIVLPVLNQLLEILRPIVNWFANLSDGTKKTAIMLGLVVAAIGPLLIAFGAVIRAVGTIGGLFSRFNNIGLSIIRLFTNIGTATTASSNASAVAVGVFGRLLGVFKLLGKALGFVLKNLMRFIPGIGLLLTAFELLKFVFEQFGIDITDGLVRGLKFGWDKIKEALIWLGDALISLFKTLFGINSPSTLFHQFGVWIMEGLLNGIVEMFSLIFDSINIFWNIVVSIFNSFTEFIVGIVSNFVSSVIGFFSNLATTVYGLVSWLATGIINFFVNMANSVVGLAWQLVNGVTKAFNSMVKFAWDAGASVANAIWTGVTNAVNWGLDAAKGAWRIGANIVEGIAGGISSGIDAVGKAIDWVSDKTIGRFKKKNKIKSPSRLYRDEASWLPLGAAEGILDGIPTVENAMDKLSDAANNQFALKNKGISMVADTSFNSNGFAENSSNYGSGGFNVSGDVIVQVQKVTDLTNDELQRRVTNQFFARARQRE